MTKSVFFMIAAVRDAKTCQALLNELDYRYNSGSLYRTTYDSLKSEYTEILEEYLKKEEQQDE